MVYGNNTASLVETEDFLANSTPIHVIPSYASVNEMVYYVIESSEQDFNNFMMNIGISELNHLEESGTEMIYEDGSKKTIIDKAQELFQKMWGKVQGLIQKALDAIAKQADKIRKGVIDKLGKKFLAKRVDGLKADKDFGQTYENYLSAYDISAASKGYIDKLEAQDKVIDNAYQSITSNKKTDDTESVASMESTCEKAIKAAISSISGKSDPPSISSLASGIKENIRGTSKSCNGSWVKSNWSTIVTEAGSYSKTKAELKKDYNKLKKHFNEAIRKCRKANNEHFKANAFTKAINAYKQIRQVATVTEQAVISCVNERHSFYRSIVLKVAGSKPVKEAYTSESSTVDAIDSLFNW